MIEESGMGIKNPLWFVGVVEGRNDPRKEGRVQVRAFNIHGTNAQIPPENLPWAICISGNYDPNYPIPPLNSWVFGFFIDGRDAQQPMILGLIPTQMTSLIDPEANGWGVIPTSNVNLNSQGSRAIDYGQPQNSRKARGEDLDKTDVLLQEVNRITADFSSIEDGLILEEPAPGNQACYPYNRVIETAGGHCVELDDTPGAERVRIGHSEGSFIEMHQNGVVVIKSPNDVWLASEKNMCIVAKGRQMIKVEGDAAFSVNGDMVYEVNGNMQQIVRGNYELSVGGQLNLNGSEEIQARAAKVKIEANVSGISLKAGKTINIQSGTSMNIKSGFSIYQDALLDINMRSRNLTVNSLGLINLKSLTSINLQSTITTNIKAGVGIFQEAVGDINISGANIFAQSTGTFNLKSSAMFLDALGTSNIKASHVKIGGGTKVSINSAVVAIDNIIQLASSASAIPVPAAPAIGAGGAGIAIPALPAEGTELPEPAAKSAGNGGGGGIGGGFGAGGYKSPSFGGGGGYISQDDGTVEQYAPIDNTALQRPAAYVSPGALAQDTAFQQKLNEMIAKYPGLTDQKIYAIIKGESNFNLTALNSNSSAAGLFQFIPNTARGLGYTTGQILNMTAAEQLAVYDKYLAGANYRGGELGIIQAAPAYANRPGNFILPGYQKGTQEWFQNGGQSWTQGSPSAWVDANGLITVNSVNDYYRRKAGS